MFDEYLRRIKDVLLRPLSSAASGIHPTVFTAAGLAAGLVCSFFLYRGDYGAGLIFWAVNRFLDGLDGAVAREAGTSSDLGGYTDIIFDFTVYALIPFALAAGEKSYSLMLMLSVMLGLFYVNAASWMYLSAILEKRKTAASDTAVVMPAGLAGGFETAVVYTLFMIFPEKLVILFALMSVLTGVNIIQRLIWAVRNL